MTDWSKPRAYVESDVKPKPIDWFDADIKGTGWVFINGRTPLSGNPWPFNTTYTGPKGEP